VFRSKRSGFERRLAEAGIDTEINLGRTLLDRMIRHGWGDVFREFDINVFEYSPSTNHPKKIIAYYCEVSLKLRPIAYVAILYKQPDKDSNSVRWNVSVMNSITEDWDNYVICSKYDPRGELIEYV